MTGDGPWFLILHDAGGQRTVAEAAALPALQNRRETDFWIRHRRGRRLEAWNIRTDETWRYTDRGWFKQ